MVYIALFLKIKDLSGFFMQSSASQQCLAFMSVWFFLILILPLIKHLEVIDLQLKLNCIK